MLIGLLLPALSFAQSPADKLVGLLSHLTSYQANFTQKTLSDKGQVQQLSKGTMAFQRPGKFRWNTTSPNQQLLIANGPLLWIYDVDLMQATKEKIDTSDSSNPARLLSDNPASLSKDFSVTESTNDTFKLTPKSTKNAIFKAVSMTIKGPQLVMMSVDNNLGETSEFQFSNIKVNPKLPANLFQFVPAKGVDIIDSTQQMPAPSAT